MIISFSWPPEEQSPNGRVNMYSRAYAAKRYKALCHSRAVEVVAGHDFVLHPHPLFPRGRINVRITFYPPDRHKRDLDNFLARFKYGLDALQKATTIDDSRFAISMDWGDRVVEGGRVDVELEEVSHA